jgi:phasin
MQFTPFEIPDHMRDAADKSVGQAKKAFDDFIDATQKAVAKAEGSVNTFREGAADANRQALAYLEDNIAASFDLAHRLVRAKSVEEVAVIQQEYIQRQMRGMAEQGKNLGEMMKRTASAARGKKDK